MSAPSDVYWRCLSSQLKYRSQYVEVYEDYVELLDGTIIQYSRIAVPDFVIIVPIVKEKLVMIYNYRYLINKWSLELPAGFINEGEKPETTAIRELQEETGFKLSELRSLGWYYPSSSRTRQKAHIFLARDLKPGKTQREKTEKQKICIMAKNKVYSKLFKGEIKHSGTIIALVMAFPLIGPPLNNS